MPQERNFYWYYSAGDRDNWLRDSGGKKTLREVSAEIVESCRRGDREAFRALYEAYKDRVYSIALYYFHGDAAAAGDITQQVFLKLITGIRRFRGDARFSTWLYRLVVNACTDAARQRRSQTAVDSRAALEAIVAGSAHEEDFARTRMADAVKAAVSALPPKFRLAVLLRYFDHLSYAEMAATLNCSTGTDEAIGNLAQRRFSGPKCVE